MLLILVIITSLLLSALFSGIEIAFISASKLQVELRKSKGGRRGKVLSKFFEHPASFLSTMLVGNNIALVVFTTLSENLLDVQIPIENKLLATFAYTVITTIVVLIFGEFLPKTLFRLFADQILYALVFPLRAIQFLLLIVSWPMFKLANFLIGFFIKDSKEEVEEVFTRLDLENFIKRTSPNDEEEEIDKQLFENALHLRDVRVKECMVPRPEIKYIDMSASISDLEALIKSTKLSRIIVTQDNDIDDILGYVHHQQLLSEPRNIQSLILEIPIVPQTMQ
ncbi:MAG: CNNM domain-containing protein, partial [Bacteroidota bacterium]